MWKQFGLVLLVLFLGSLPIFSVDVEEMSTEEILTELSINLMMDSKEWEEQREISNQVLTGLNTLNQRLPNYQDMLGKISTESMLIEKNLKRTSDDLTKVSSEMLEVKNYLQSLKKDLTLARIEGVTIGIAVSAIVIGSIYLTTQL